MYIVTFVRIPAAHHHHHHHEGTVKSAHCSSEPRLTDNDISPGLRRRGSRRGQSMHHSHHRKSNAFLDVPDTSSQMPSREEGEDEDSYRLRSFSLTSKGEFTLTEEEKSKSLTEHLAPSSKSLFLTLVLLRIFSIYTVSN